MTVKIFAVVAGQKYSTVIEGEEKDLVTQMKMQICTVLMNQAAWLTQLEISEG